MNESESDNLCDSSPSKSPVNTSLRKSKRVRSDVPFVTPDSDSEKDISPRKLGRPLRFPTAELMAVPAKLIDLLSWKNFTTEFLKSIQSTGLWKLLIDRLERFIKSTEIPKQKYLELLKSESWPLSKSAQNEVYFRVMVIRGFLNLISFIGPCSTYNISKLISLSFIVSMDLAQKWTLQFISSGGYLKGIGIRGKRTPYSILKDQESRDTMKRWLLQATKVIPPMK